MSVPCPKCPKRVKSKSALSSHVSFYHSTAAIIHMPTDNGSFEEITVTRTSLGHVHCPVCDKGYSCSASLQAHVKMSCIGEEKIKNCPYCDKAFRHLRFYSIHVERKVCLVAKERVRLRASGAHIQDARKLKSIDWLAKENIRLTTDNDSKVTRLTSNRKTNSSKVTAKSKSTPKPDGTKKPCKRGPPISNFKCPFCKTSFKTRNNLQKHFEEECFEPPFGGEKGRLSCFECSRCFEYQKELNMHSHNYHQDEVTVRVNRQDHIVVRNEFDKFDCPECHLMFSFPSYLEAHVFYFCGETSIKCPECASPFETTLQLNTHINSFHTNWLPSPQTTTPELLSPTSSALTSPSISSLDDPMLSKKFKRVGFRCHSCLSSFESDQDMKDHIYSDTCAPKTGQSMKRKKQDITYRRLKHVKVKYKEKI